jgi:hypothetical protein
MINPTRPLIWRGPGPTAELAVGAALARARAARAISRRYSLEPARQENTMLFDRARLRAWFVRKDPIDVALDLVAELRVDIRVLQRRLAEVPEVVATARRRSSRGRTPRRRLNGKSPSRSLDRKRRALGLDKAEQT